MATPRTVPHMSGDILVKGVYGGTERENEELLKVLRKARSAKKARLKRLGELLPTNGRSVTLSGQLQALDPDVVVEELEVPVQNQAFGARTVTADKKAKLRVMLDTAVGPVEPMGMTEVLVVDVDDGEFIVGNDLLTSLGIDASRQLEQLADRGEVETSGDPIELEADKLPVRGDGSAPSGDAEIFAAVERLIDRMDFRWSMWSNCAPSCMRTMCGAWICVETLQLTFHRWKCLYGTGLVQRNVSPGSTRRMYGNFSMNLTFVLLN
ncbi:hypothetical protein PC123_g14944 [Phytophthora cactorum]|nr:hypothetical protein PC123_g14944 [Phytophthora cactorum]